MYLRIVGEEWAVPAEESVTLVFLRSQPPAPQPLGMVWAPGMLPMQHPPTPRWAPLLLPSPAEWPVGQLLPRGLEEEEEEEL